MEEKEVGNSKNGDTRAEAEKECEMMAAHMKANTKSGDWMNVTGERTSWAERAEDEHGIDVLEAEGVNVVIGCEFVSL